MTTATLKVYELVMLRVHATVAHTTVGIEHSVGAEVFEATAPSGWGFTLTWAFVRDVVANRQRLANAVKVE